MRVFITGGTGLVGKRLIRRLRERDDSVVLLTRRPAAARESFGESCTVVEGDPTQEGRWMEAVANCDAVINLAGENLFAKRWNEDFKKRMYESRVKGTEHVVKALARAPKTAGGEAKVLVSASAIGYYGPHGDEEVTEDSPAGSDYLAKLCVDWEAAAKAGEAQGLRVALVRVGVVLDREGGALAQMLTPFKLGMGGPVGSGKQWMSWVHHEDLVGLLLLPLGNRDLCGPFNGTAPQPVTNKDFGKALGRTLGRPAFMPTPGFMLRLMLGEVAEVITNGVRVLPKRGQAAGYSFKFPDIDGALRDIFKP